MKILYKFFLTITSIILLCSGAFAADLKVGFVYVGPPGDFGWTYQHDQGRKAVEEAFGDRVETTFAENVPEGADAVPCDHQRGNLPGAAGTGSLGAQCHLGRKSDAGRPTADAETHTH